MSVTKINYSAIYVVMATVFVLVVHTVDPTAIVGVILAILVPMVITIGFCEFFEVHAFDEKLSRKEFEEIAELQDDPDWDYYVSAMK